MTFHYPVLSPGLAQTSGNILQPTASASPVLDRILAGGGWGVGFLAISPRRYYKIVYG